MKMYVLVLILLWSLVTLASSSICRGSLCAPDIDSKSCHGDECGTLYLYTNTGEEIILKGTESNIKHKNVVKVKLVGSGCFIIYKSRRFTSDSFLVQGAGEHVLKDEGHHWTTVRSIQYAEDCIFHEKAGVEVYVIASVLGVVSIVVIMALVWSRMRKNREQRMSVPTEETA